MWLIVSASILALILWVRWNYKAIQAFMMAMAVNFQNRELGKKKEALFAPLTDLAKSVGDHNCKVLELGGGSGANFGFVKAPVDWTVTEPNVKFAPYFKETREELGGKHKVNDLVEAFAEDLGKFEPDSFDAVVVSLVLCTVNSVQDSLREIHRVLKPGGKFYFIEHVGDQKGSLRRFIQTFLTVTNIWPSIFDGCLLNRDTEDLVKQAGFSNVEIVSYTTSGIALWVLNSQIYGWATK